MFGFKSLLASALLASTATASLVPRHNPPADWEFDILEPYLDYHVRYLALQCYKQHGKPFFDECCHPHLNWQKLEDFPAQCTPSPEASASAAAAEKTHKPDATGDPLETVVVTVSSTMDSQPAPTPKPEEPKEKPTPTPQEPPKETPAPPAPKNNDDDNNNDNNNNGGGGGIVDFIFGGFGTFYFQHGNAGACGDFHSDDDLIVAMDTRRYGNTGVKSELCGKKVEIVNTKNNKSVVVTVADACPTCENADSIDLSRGAFQQIATFDEGMVPIKWRFL